MKYPAYTGDEPCAEVGPDLFFTPDKTYGYTHRGLRDVKAICDSCSMRDACLDYALHVNVSGIWGGTTETQRKSLRRQLNIIAQPVLSAS
jgi:WhiB family transcriptional regulator, redox-sensing transcriptional regulator